MAIKWVFILCIKDNKCNISIHGTYVICYCHSILSTVVTFKILITIKPVFFISLEINRKGNSFNPAFRVLIFFLSILNLLFYFSWFDKVTFRKMLLYFSPKQRIIYSFWSLHMISINGVKTFLCALNTLYLEKDTYKLYLSSYKCKTFLTCDFVRFIELNANMR